VALLRRRFGERRIGHAGTLDPTATGVLVVGIGSATRLLRFATAGRKSYECEIVFGIETSTLDAAGETIATWCMDLDPTEVADAAAGFVGSISQLPPMVSAVRVGGRRLHEIARSGEAAERVPRQVEVYRFDVEPTGDPQVYRASVDCSAGTYVRTLGADLGSRLGGGAHIRALRRTRSGSFSLAEAELPEQAALRPPGELVRDLVQIRLSEDDAANARLLDYLDRESTGLDDRLRTHVVELRETLDSLTGLADLTASDLFDRFRTPLPRAMSLLFLRSTCADLLAFEHDALTTEDWLAAALLFGARAGWLALPLSLRGGPAVSAAVSHRMAALSHRVADTGFELGPAPLRPKPLAELFAGPWNARRQDAAVYLARAQEWTDCLQTRVKLSAGDYVLKVGRGGTEIVFPGEARGVETDVDRTRFSTLLVEASIDPEHEAAAIEMLADGGGATPGARRRKVRRRGGTRRVGK